MSERWEENRRMQWIMEEGNRQEEGRVRNNLFLSFSGKVNQISSCGMNSTPALLFLPAPLFLLIKQHLQTKLPLTLRSQAGETSPSCVTCPCQPHLHSFYFLWLPQRFSFHVAHYNLFLRNSAEPSALCVFHSGHFLGGFEEHFPARL